MGAEIYIKCSHCNYKSWCNRNWNCPQCGLPLKDSKRYVKGHDMVDCVIMGALFGTLLLPLIGTIIGAYIGWYVASKHPDKPIKE